MTGRGTRWGGWQVVETRTAMTDAAGKPANESAALRVERVLRLIPRLDIMTPLRGLIVSLSRPDQRRVWASSGPYLTVGKRHVTLSDLRGQLPRVMQTVTQRVEALYQAVLEALECQANGDVAGAVAQGHAWALDRLVALARIPSVSAEGHDPAEVRRSADETAATLSAAGFDDVFAHGMLSMAHLGRLLTAHVPASRLRTFGVRFTTITPIHARPRCHGVVTDVVDGVAHAELTVSLEDGTTTLRGYATYELDERGSEPSAAEGTTV